jgi:hypothetical protein
VPPAAQVVVDMTRAEPARPAPVEAPLEPPPDPVERSEPAAGGAEAGAQKPEAAEPPAPQPAAPQRSEVDRVALTREFSQLFGDGDGERR